MASLDQFHKKVLPKKWKDEAMRMSMLRISTEYARDTRLSENERILKIYYGYLGEFAFAEYCLKNNIDHKYLGSEVTNSPDNGDFKMSFDIIIDVKTQENKFFPQPDWRCEVTDEQIKRLPSSALYVFCKLLNENELYIVGWMSKKQFLNTAIFRQKGSILRGKKVHYSKWDVTIDELEPIASLITYFDNYEH